MPRSPLAEEHCCHSISVHGPPGEKKFKMSLKRLFEHLPNLSSLMVGPLVEWTWQHCLFFEQSSKIYSKRISTAVKARVHELHIFPSFLFCLLDFFLAVDLSLAGKSPSLFKYLNFCCGIAAGLYEGQSKPPSQQIILQTLLLQPQNSFSCSLQRWQFQPSPKSLPIPHCYQCSVQHRRWQAVQWTLLIQNYFGQPK